MWTYRRVPWGYPGSVVSTPLSRHATRIALLRVCTCNSELVHGNKTSYYNPYSNRVEVTSVGLTHARPIILPAVWRWIWSGEITARAGMAHILEWRFVIGILSLLRVHFQLLSAGTNNCEETLALF